MIAAVVIALLPMLVLGFGIVAPADNPHELAGRGSSFRLGAVDARAARELQVMAYTRRASELNRLREMASVPLAAWVAAPTGTGSEQAASGPPRAAAEEPDVAGGQLTASVAAAALTGSADQSSAPQTSGPAAPSILPSTDGAAAQTEPPPKPVAAVAAPATSEAAASATAPAVVAPPLPHPRPKIALVRRTRLVRAKPAPQKPANPFNGLFGASPSAATPAAR